MSICAINREQNKLMTKAFKKEIIGKLESYIFSQYTLIEFCLYVPDNRQEGTVDVNQTMRHSLISSIGC